MTGILIGVLALGLAQQTDTTFSVRPGVRLDLDVGSGSVVVKTWDRNAVRVRASGRGARAIEIRHRGNTIQLDGDHGPPHVNLEITAPARSNVSIDALNSGITIDGVQGNIDLENLDGPIVVRNVTGSVKVESVSGKVMFQNVRGRIKATTQNEALQFADIHGDIEAETTNGNIVMRGVEAARVEAITVNGFVEYRGSIRDGGRYHLATHNGRITMAVPEQTNASVSVSAHNGTVQAEFPVPLTGMRERRYSFTLGSGSARIDLESFNGIVHLVRPKGR